MRRSLRLPFPWILGFLALSGCTGAPHGRISPGALDGWNVLLVTIDTLRADRLGFMGWTAAVTPNLDGLAERGVVFEDAVASSPVTLPSHASILTGLDPLRHGALDNGRYTLPADVPTLATWLSDMGYETHAVIASYVLHRKYGLARGFDDYDDRFRGRRRGFNSHLERPASEVSDRAIRWLGSRDAARPFFLWVHYYDPHSPYEPPAEYRARFALDPYDGEIAATDEQVGRLLETLRASGQLERTLVVFVADHGEAFGDGGEQTHGILLRDATLHVPLVISAPGALPSGARVSGVARQVDVAPTVLALLGSPVPPDLTGSSLLPAIRDGVSRGRVAYSLTRLPLTEFGWSPLSGVRDDDWAYVRAPRAELYDRRRDPRETRNLAGEQGDVARRYDALVEEREQGGREGTSRGLDEDDREALRALGYADGGDAPPATGVDPKDRLELWARMNALQDSSDAGRFEPVVEQVPALLAAEPENARLLRLYGEALAGLGRAAEGVPYVERAFGVTGMRDKDGIALARILARAGRPADAEKLLRTFTRQEPEYSEHWFNLGVLYASQGRDRDAVDAYEHALALRPEAPHLLTNLGSSLARVTGGDSARAARAIDLLDRAVKASGDADHRPALVRAEALAELGRTEEARTALTELAARPRLRGVQPSDIAEAIRRLP